jgi:hypothetical protein
MFKKQKKLDSKIRFQHTTFTKRLDEARNYKRKVTPKAEGQADSILARLGLRTIYSQIAALLIVVGIGYLIYIPNFLSIKGVEVKGVSDEDRGRLQTRVFDYFNHTPFYNPQRNIFFLGKGRLENFLLLDGKVYKVTEINKNFFSRSLTITIQPKNRSFIVKRPEGVFAVYNDGVVEQQLDTDPEKWLEIEKGSLKVLDETEALVQAHTKYFSDNLAGILQTVQSQFTQLTNQELDNVSVPQQIIYKDTPDEIATGTATTPALLEEKIQETVKTLSLPLEPEDLNLIVKKLNYKGSSPTYKVVISTQRDLAETLKNLFTVLSQMAPERYRNLHYIDMRFENKGFVCLINTPCAQDNTPAPIPAGDIIIPPAATSTATTPINP